MARFDLMGITVELTEGELEMLHTLASEAPWRFSNRVVPESVRDRFGFPYPALERLRQSGLVTFQYYFTGAVSEYDLSAIGRAFMESVAKRTEPGAQAARPRE
jgi:hypothetical protein